MRQFKQSLKYGVTGVAVALMATSAQAATDFDTSGLTDTLTAVAVAFGVVGAAYVGIPVIKWGWKKVASFFGG